MSAGNIRKRSRLRKVYLFFRPLFDYAAKNKLVFAALVYSLVLHAVEKLAWCLAGFRFSFSPPLFQGMWVFMALFGLCLLAGGVPAKILLTVTLLLQSVEAFCSIFLNSVFSLEFGEEIFVIFLASSPREVREFFVFLGSWKVILCALAALGAFAAVIYAVWKTPLKRKPPLYLICELLILPQLINFFVQGRYDDICEKNSLLHLIVHAGKFSDGMRKLAELEKHPELPKNIACEGGNENLLAVIVIGESANRFHHSLYGYPRPTNPELGAKRELCVFTDGISGFANTVRACAYMLTAADAQNREDYRYTLFDVFKAAGFATHHYSNQNRWGRWDSPITIFSCHADDRYFLQEHSAGAFDDRLVEAFGQRLAGAAPRPRMVLFHLLGSHSVFEKRSPKAWKVFSAADRPRSPYGIDAWETVDEYDNSIRFTDHVLGRIVGIVDAHPGPAFMLYTSDHGEFPEAFSRDTRSGSSTAPEHYEIPFVFYANAAYRKKFPEVMAAIRKNLNKPFTTENFMYPCFSAARIDFDGFPREKDLFSPAFAPPSERHLGDHTTPYPARTNPYAVSAPPTAK